MKTIYCSLVFSFFVFLSSSSFAQEQRFGPTIGLSYFTTHDQHSGALLTVESFLNDHIFFTYALGASQSHYFKWEYIINWDVGYRFKLKNGYRPDIRIGFGNLLGYYKGEMKTSKGEILEYDDIETFLTTNIKLGLLNLDLYPKHQIPIQFIGNIGVRGQFPIETDVKWHLTFELGVGYHLK